jgi:hypothetical protein
MDIENFIGFCSMNGHGFHREDLRFYGKHNDNFFRSFTGCFPSLLVAYKE